MPRSYNDPYNGSESQIGTQIRTDKYKKKALIELKKEQYFSQQADVTAMPKHYGKKIKQYLYVPMLDERNTSDQGIDAAGATLVNTEWTAWNESGVVQGTAYANEAAAWTAAGARGSVNQNGGNLYGSSKDVGAISGKMPVLSESGGRVNRVGFTRLELEGTFENFGFFDEYTKDSVDFDSDDDLMMHVNREMTRGANEITEDAIQIDLLNGAGTVRYPGAATSKATISGENGAVTEVTYSDLMKLGIDLDNNRTPKHTTIIVGSRMIDTRVINGTRVLYIGSELQPTLERMKDLHDRPAFINVAHYADAGNLLNGEIGSVGPFRIVVVPEMMHWAGKGAVVTSNDGYRETNNYYDVFPMLAVGDGAFTTIGFQTDGKTVKFKIIHKKPGEKTANVLDPYGKTGFMSIQWYYGLMLLRPERLALMLTVAEV